MCSTPLASMNKKDQHVECKSKSVKVVYPSPIGHKKIHGNKANKFSCLYCNADFFKELDIKVSR